MLYSTTRNKTNTFPANQALSEQRGLDGGFYVPLQIPKLSKELLGKQSSNETVAEVLNLFFSTQLTGRDVDLAIGKFPVRLFSMNHRISVVESWHNLDWDFNRMVKNLSACIRGTRETEQGYGIWAQIAIRISVICGAYTEALSQKILDVDACFDIAVPSVDFSCAISAWYCREMGIPIQNIVICCNENNNLWELFNHGEMRTGRGVVATSTPECDHSVPELLEYLIFFCGSVSKVQEFLRCCDERRTYFPPEDLLNRMRAGFYVSVIGQSRTAKTIPGAYGTHGYILGPYSALTYAGALDYRARTGENRHIFLLSEKGALLHDSYVSSAMGTSIDLLHQILD